MKKSLIPLAGLTVALAVLGTTLALTLGGDEIATADQSPAGVEEQPSDALPPIRSDEGIDPDECNQVHNITACEDRYEVVVQFNTSVTQEDMEEAEAILGAYDEGLEFLIQESWPPTGRAFLASDAPDFCSAVEAELEAESYVSSVSCQPWQEADAAEPDAPVEHRNDMTD